MVRRSTDFSRALRAALTEHSDAGRTLGQLGLSIAAEEGSRERVGNFKAFTKLDPMEKRAARWVNRLSSWQQGTALPADVEMLLLAVGVVAENSQTTWWTDMYGRAQQAHRAAPEHAATAGETEADGQSAGSDDRPARAGSSFMQSAGGGIIVGGDQLWINGDQTVINGGQTIIHGDQTVVQGNRQSYARPHPPGPGGHAISLPGTEVGDDDERHEEEVC